MMSRVFIKLGWAVVGVLLLAIATGALVKYELTRPKGSTEDSFLSYLSRNALWLAELAKYPYTGVKSLLASNLAVQDRFPEHTGFVGDPNEEEHYLLLSRYDGDIKKPVVELVDLGTFEVQHTWVLDLELFVDTWNERVAEHGSSRQSLINVATHPMMVSDGLVFNTLKNPLRKVDACSQLVWQKTPTPHSAYHHSVEVDVDGNIWSLGANSNRFHPLAVDRLTSKTYDDDSIIKLNTDGEILYSKSIFDILIENDLGYLAWGTKFSAYTPDWLHTNDAQPANSDTKYWKKGDVLVSARTPSLVFLYRPSTNKLIWYSIGYTHAQHDVDFVDDSRISIFDNNSPTILENTPPVDESVVDETVWSDGHNQVLVFDFATQKYSSYLNASLQKHKVRSNAEGLSEILPNGDLFVEETRYGRTLYFNADGSLRWSHVNRAENDNVYIVGWSRMLYREHEIAMVRDFLKKKTELLVSCK